MQNLNHFSYARQYGTHYLSRLCRRFPRTQSIRPLLMNHWGLYCHQRRHQVLRSVLVATSLLFYFNLLSVEYQSLSAYWEEITTLIPAEHCSRWPSVQELANHAKCQEVLPFITQVAKLTWVVDVNQSVKRWCADLRQRKWVTAEQCVVLRRRWLHYGQHWDELKTATKWRELLIGFQHRWRQHINLRYFQRQWVLPLFMCLFMVVTEVDPHAPSLPAIDGEYPISESRRSLIQLFWRLLDWSHQRQLFYLLLKLYRQLGDIGSSLKFYSTHEIDPDALTFMRSLNVNPKQLNKTGE
jgi:hypothetical protein